MRLFLAYGGEGFWVRFFALSVALSQSPQDGRGPLLPVCQGVKDPAQATNRPQEKTLLPAVSSSGRLRCLIVREPRLAQGFSSWGGVQVWAWEERKCDLACAPPQPVYPA